MTPRRCCWPSALLPGLLLIGVLAGAPAGPTPAGSDTGRNVELEVTQC